MHPLPLAPLAPPSRRRLPLASTVREVDRAARPIHAIWEITLRCDQACGHCGSRAARARPDELSTPEALGVTRQLAELGVREVTLIGGEAYLREDWTMIAGAIRDHGMTCTMTTGGRGMTAERAREARAAGISRVSVSIDGLRETHDVLRGVRGSHDAALAALGHLRAAGIYVGVNTQINRKNWRELRALFELIADAGARAWQVQLTVPMGRAADDPEIILEPHRMIELGPILSELSRGADARGMRLWAANNVGYFGPSERVLRGDRPRRAGGTCGAGILTLGLEANGDVKACPSLSSAEYAGGNVRDASLRDIWERAEPLRFVRSRTIEDLWGRCRDCYYAEACMAGCSWTSHAIFGKPGNNPFCEHRALQLRDEGKRERLVRVRAAEGTPFDHGIFEVVEEPWMNHEEDR